MKLLAELVHVLGEERAASALRRAWTAGPDYLGSPLTIVPQLTNVSVVSARKFDCVV